MGTRALHWVEGKTIPHPSTRWALALWVTFLISLSLVPLPIKTSIGTTGRWHSVGHYVAFLVTAALASGQARTRRQRSLAGALSLVLGMLLEAAEVALYRNRFEWQDVLTDGLGILSGLLLTSFVLPQRLGPRTPYSATPTEVETPRPSRNT